MNVVTHDNPLKAQLKRARRMQVGGLIAIFVAFILSFATLSFETNFLLLALVYALMLIGFPVWTLGRTTLRRLSAAPRADLLTGNELKGLSDKYSLHHFLNLDGVTIPHLLVTPSGLVVLNSSDAFGKVVCAGGEAGDRWQSPSKALERLSGLNPPIGNPSRELETAIGAARELLAKSGKPNVPVAGLIVFTRNPDLTSEGCTYRAIPLGELKQAVRDMQSEMEQERSDGAKVDSMLTNDDRRRINSMLTPKPSVPAAKPAAARR